MMVGTYKLTLITLVGALAACSAGACSRGPATPVEGSATEPVEAASEQVTEAELTAFLDWQAEFRAMMREVQREATALVAAGASAEVRTEAVRKNRERALQLEAREPFKETRRGEAMKAVLQAFFASGSFFRDEKELARLREAYGAPLIDSIAARDALFRDKLAP
jgi:hypothetical protein